MGFFPYLLKVQNARKRLTKKDFKENEVEIKQQFLGEEGAILTIILRGACDMLNKHIVRPFKKDFGKKIADIQRRGKPAKTRTKKGRV